MKVWGMNESFLKYRTQDDKNSSLSPESVKLLPTARWFLEQK